MAVDEVEVRPRTPKPVLQNITNVRCNSNSPQTRASIKRHAMESPRNNLSPIVLKKILRDSTVHEGSPTRRRPFGSKKNAITCSLGSQSSLDSSPLRDLDPNILDSPLLSTSSKDSPLNLPRRAFSRKRGQDLFMNLSFQNSIASPQSSEVSSSPVLRSRPFQHSKKKKRNLPNLSFQQQTSAPVQISSPANHRRPLTRSPKTRKDELQNLSFQASSSANTSLSSTISDTGISRPFQRGRKKKRPIIDLPQSESIIADQTSPGSSSPAIQVRPLQKRRKLAKVRILDLTRDSSVDEKEIDSSHSGSFVVPKLPIRRRFKPAVMFDISTAESVRNMSYSDSSLDSSLGLRSRPMKIRQKGRDGSIPDISMASSQNDETSSPREIDFDSVFSSDSMGENIDEPRAENTLSRHFLLLPDLQAEKDSVERSTSITDVDTKNNRSRHSMCHSADNSMTALSPRGVLSPLSQEFAQMPFSERRGQNEVESKDLSYEGSQPQSTQENPRSVENNENESLNASENARPFSKKPRKSARSIADFSYEASQRCPTPNTEDQDPAGEHSQNASEHVPPFTKKDKLNNSECAELSYEKSQRCPSAGRVDDQCSREDLSQNNSENAPPFSKRGKSDSFCADISYETSQRSQSAGLTNTPLTQQEGKKLFHHRRVNKTFPSMMLAESIDQSSKSDESADSSSSTEPSQHTSSESEESESEEDPTKNTTEIDEERSKEESHNETEERSESLQEASNHSEVDPAVQSFMPEIQDESRHVSAENDDKLCSESMVVSTHQSTIVDEIALASSFDSLEDSVHQQTICPQRPIVPLLNDSIDEKIEKLKKEAKENKLKLLRMQPPVKLGPPRRKPPVQNAQKKDKLPRTKLFKPAYWANRRLYSFLEQKLRAEYKIDRMVMAVKAVKKMHETIVLVTRSKQHPKTAIEGLKVELAKLKIVSTTNDFYSLVKDYLPVEFQKKVIPALVPCTNGVVWPPQDNHKRDCEPILDDTD